LNCSEEQTELLYFFWLTWGRTQPLRKIIG
jgi:hypothetical protein